MGTLAEKTRELVDIECGTTEMTLRFADGGSATAPYWWYPRLRDATPEERQNWQISGSGRGIWWPGIDEDLSVTGILEGRKAKGAVPPEKGQ
jgi:hypothetical protein